MDGLHMIVGNSGSGKTRRLYEILTRQAQEMSKERFFLIVPEQYTLQAQREIVEYSSCHGTFNIDIVSFMRLSYRVFEELGTKLDNVLEDYGKSMLLRKVIGQLDGQFRLYNHMMDKEGFIDQIKSCLSEFYQYDIKEETLHEMILQSEDKKLLQYKLSDLFKIYSAFQQALGEEYQITEQLLSLLADVAAESELLKNAHFFFDGFTGFTPVQYHFLDALMDCGKNFYFTLTMDEKSYLKPYVSPYNIFSMSKTTYEKLVKLYVNKEHAGEVENILLFDRPFPRYQKSPDIAALEESLFRYPAAPYEGQVSHITLKEAANVRAEAAYVAKQIREYVRKGTFRYRDIAVVSAAEEEYAPIIRQEFITYHIPFFLDHNSEVTNHPFVECMRCALVIVCDPSYGYSYNVMMRYVHTGLAGVTPEEAELLDNYLVATNTIGRSAWHNGFVKIPKSMWIRSRNEEKKQEEIQKRDAYLIQINEIRERIMSRLKPLQKEMDKKGKIRDKAAAIYQYLIASEFPQKLKVREEELKQSGQLSQAKVYEQIFPSMLALLDKLVAILGEETDISNEELAGILDAGLSDMAVGVIPSTMDQVVVGDFTRTRLKDVKVLFVLGMNDCYIPKAVSSPNVLTLEDRKSIAGMGVELAPSDMSAAVQEQFYLYLMLTKPECYLHISYARMDASGQAMRPSCLLHKITSILPQLPKEVLYREVYLDTKESMCAYLSQCIKEYLQGEMSDTKAKELAAMIRFCRQDEEYNNILDRILEAMGYRNEEVDIGTELARQLYGENLLLSVTRMERYAGCAYSHFLKYGLNLQEREEYAFAGVDFGNVMHDVLESFGRRMKQEYDYETITEAQIEKLTEECVNQSLQQYGYDFSLEGARQQYAQKIILRMANRTLKVLCRHIKLGSFKPEGFELSFGPGKTLEGMHYPLKPEGSVCVQGKIDRMDLAVQQENGHDKVYVKVMDYKTGIKKFDITLAYYGLQMQLITYMLVSLKAGRSGELNRQLEDLQTDSAEFEPGALLYYHVQDPIFEGEETLYELEFSYKHGLISQEEYENRRDDAITKAAQMHAKEYVMDGLVNAKEEVLHAMEEPGDPPKQSMESISVKYKKDGSLYASSKCQSEEELNAVLSYTEQKMQDIAQSIVDGKNSLNPYEYKDMTSCAYCPYAAVCQFDERNGNAYRVLEEKSVQDFRKEEETDVESSESH